MYRVALIGCGRIAPAHLVSLAELKARARAVAICDMNATLRQERQQEYGVPHGFGSVSELIDWSEFDIAVVLTPPDVRSVVCSPLFEAGKHVMVEKPFTLSMEEARSIVEAAEQAGVTLAVSQNFRWFPPAPRLREEIAKGRLGRVLSMLQIDAGWRDESAGWRNTTGNLALSVMGVHWLDQYRWILGEDAVRVYAASLVSGQLTSVGEDITSTLITFESGAIVTLVHHWASHARRAANLRQIDGTEGSVIVQGNQLRWIAADGSETVEPIEPFSVPRSVQRSWTELLDALDEERLPCHHGRDNLATVAILTGAYQAARTGEAVRIGE